MLLFTNYVVLLLIAAWLSRFVRDVTLESLQMREAPFISEASSDLLDVHFLAKQAVLANGLHKVAVFICCLLALDHNALSNCKESMSVPVIVCGCGRAL